MIDMPSVFNFEDKNINTSIKFLNKLYGLREKDKIQIILRDTIKIDDIGLMLLKAMLEKVNAYHLKNFKEPISVHLNKVNKKIWAQVQQSFGKGKAKSKEQDNTIHFFFDGATIGLSKANYQKINEVSTSTSYELVYGLNKIKVKEFFSPFYNFLIEIIMNTVDHGIKKNEDINFWLINNRQGSKHISYSCVDMGGGVINSYKNACSLNKVKFIFKHKGKLLKDILNGVLGSSTGEEGRGNGMPTIRKIVKDGYVKSFTLITNGVLLTYNSTNREFITKKITKFDATYYSWIIDRECFKLWKKELDI